MAMSEAANLFWLQTMPFDLISKSNRNESKTKFRWGSGRSGVRGGGRGGGWGFFTDGRI